MFFGTLRGVRVRVRVRVRVTGVREAMNHNKQTTHAHTQRELFKNKGDFRVASTHSKERDTFQHSFHPPGFCKSFMSFSIFFDGAHGMFVFFHQPTQRRCERKKNVGENGGFRTELRARVESLLKSRYCTRPEARGFGLSLGLGSEEAGQGYGSGYGKVEGG